MVELVQTVFIEGRLAEENMWQAVVLTPKGKKEYCGIGLVEVMWKVVAAIFKSPAHSLHHLPQIPTQI